MSNVCLYCKRDDAKHYHTSGRDFCLCHYCYEENSCRVCCSPWDRIINGHKLCEDCSQNYLFRGMWKFIDEMRTRIPYCKQCEKFGKCECEMSDEYKEVVGDGPKLDPKVWGESEEKTNGLKNIVEAAEEGIPAIVEGVKYDTGKLPWDLLPWKAVESIVEILHFGATVKKYGPRNWESGFNYGRVYSALIRHLTAWWEGEDLDPESGKSHLAHAGCNILFLLTFTQRGTGTDDRPGTNN